MYCWRLGAWLHGPGFDSRSGKPPKYKVCSSPLTSFWKQRNNSLMIVDTFSSDRDLCQPGRDDIKRLQCFLFFLAQFERFCQITAHGNTRWVHICFACNSSWCRWAWVVYLSPPVHFAWWAHMRCFLSVCQYGLDQKIRLDNNSYLGKHYSERPEISPQYRGFVGAFRKNMNYTLKIFLLVNMVFLLKFRL